MEGIYRAVQFTFKVWICVASLALLTLTTRFSSLIHAMEKFRIPKIFVMMIAITYRFIFLFINEAYRMFLAKESRTVTKERRLRFSVLKTLANIASTLFIRAYERGETVYLAMLARGYTGEAKSLSKMRCNRRDWAFGIASVPICLAILLIEFTGLGI
jgi:cobalt/nickel transport system permease protein